MLHSRYLDALLRSRGKSFEALTPEERVEIQEHLLARYLSQRAMAQAFDHPSVFSAERARTLRGQGWTHRAIGQHFGVHEATVALALKRLRQTA